MGKILGDRMNEPLKGKIIKEYKTIALEGFKIEDVKSAVEWLLKKIDEAKTDIRGDNVYKVPIWWVEDLIKKAFEDVI